MWQKSRGRGLILHSVAIADKDSVAHSPGNSSEGNDKEGSERRYTADNYNYPGFSAIGVLESGFEKREGNVQRPD